MDEQRRALLKAGAAGGAVLAAAAAMMAQAQTPSAASALPPTGKPGEFDFLSGNWKIHHRMLKAGSWDVFEGEATCWSILGGIASIEELRIPARNFSGMGLRLLDQEKKVWNDFWVNAKSGALGAEGVPGVFENGVGSFISEDEADGKPIKVRGVWDRITATSCRWRQGSSRDGGKSWEDNWLMDWTKA